MQIRSAYGSKGVSANIKGVHVQSFSFELDIPKKTIVLRGSVRVKQNQNWVSADEARIDMTTKTISMIHVKASLNMNSILKPNSH